jgi:hypothetical protein
MTNNTMLLDILIKYTVMYYSHARHKACVTAVTLHDTSMMDRQYNTGQLHAIWLLQQAQKHPHNRHIHLNIVSFGFHNRSPFHPPLVVVVH